MMLGFAAARRRDRLGACGRRLWRRCLRFGRCPQRRGSREGRRPQQDVATAQAAMVRSVLLLSHDTCLLIFNGARESAFRYHAFPRENTCCLERLVRRRADRTFAVHQTAFREGRKRGSAVHGDRTCRQRPRRLSASRCGPVRHDRFRGSCQGDRTADRQKHDFTCRFFRQLWSDPNRPFVAMQFRKLATAHEAPRQEEGPGTPRTGGTASIA